MSDRVEKSLDSLHKKVDFLMEKMGVAGDFAEENEETGFVRDNTYAEYEAEKEIQAQRAIKEEKDKEVLRLKAKREQEERAEKAKEKAKKKTEMLAYLDAEYGSDDDLSRLLEEYDNEEDFNSFNLDKEEVLDKQTEEVQESLSSLDEDNFFEEDITTNEDLFEEYDEETIKEELDPFEEEDRKESQTNETEDALDQFFEEEEKVFTETEKDKLEDIILGIIMEDDLENDDKNFLKKFQSEAVKHVQEMSSQLNAEELERVLAEVKSQG